MPVRLGRSGSCRLHGREFSPIVNRIRRRNRVVSVLLTVCYGLTVTVSALFHNHGDFCGGCSHITSAAANDDSPHCSHGDPSTHGGMISHQPSPDQSPTDGSHCIACQFLAKKSLSVAENADLTSFVMVQWVVLATLPRSVAISPSPWHSRAPPDFS